MIEKRISNGEVKASEESRHVEGYALVFDTPSSGLSQFTEVIQRGAVTEEIIKKSDIVMTINHDQSRGILARSSYGEGSLKLTVDERGLKYEFDAPKTALGDELLEALRRGDIRSSSFAFTTEVDVWEMRNGEKWRTIEKIKQLYDVSAVTFPAYDATSVVIDERGLKALDEKLKAEAEAKEAEEREAEKPAEEPKEEPAKEEPKEEEKPAEERNSDKDTLYNKGNNTIYRNMPQINLTQAIRAAVSGKMTEEQASIFNEARSQMIKNGIAVGDNEIVMPFEQRATPPATANGVFTASYTDAQGAVNVQTDVYSILEPLRNALILGEAGATVLSGLRGNVRIPRMSKGNAYFELETAEAQKSGQTFDKVELRPHRISAYVEISKALLAMSEDTNINDVITRDVIAAISEKIESQFFSANAAADDRFGGVFNGITANTAAVKYGDIVDYETAMEEANVNNFIYVLSPKARAALRKLPLDSGSGRFALENNEVLGRKSLVSGNVANNGLLLVNPQDIVYGIWSNGISLVVDPYTSALNDTVRVVVTIYVDVKMRRSESVKAVILKA